MNEPQLQDLQDLLLAALRAVYGALGPPRETRPGSGVYAGWNLPEALSCALVDLAEELGGSEMLVAHRPGCWEAGHVRALAAQADSDRGLGGR